MTTVDKTSSAHEKIICIGESRSCTLVTTVKAETGVVGVKCSFV